MHHPSGCTVYWSTSQDVIPGSKSPSFLVTSLSILFILVLVTDRTVHGLHDLALTVRSLFTSPNSRLGGFNFEFGSGGVIEISIIINDFLRDN
jgi:hypothetical protein